MKINHRFTVVGGTDAPAPWPEPSRAPLPTYSVPPIPREHMASATADLDMIEVLRAQHRRRAAEEQRRADLRFRARFWLALFGGTFLLAVVAVAFVAGREQAAGHEASAVNG